MEGYKERLLDEFFELNEKRSKLIDFLFAPSPLIDENSLHLLELQNKAMQEYEKILLKRIKKEF